MVAAIVATSGRIAPSAVPVHSAAPIVRSVTIVGHIAAIATALSVVRRAATVLTAIPICAPNISRAAMAATGARLSPIPTRPSPSLRR